MMYINNKVYTIDIDKLKEFLSINKEGSVVSKEITLDEEGKIVSQVHKDDGVTYEIDGAKYDLWTNMLSYGGTINFEADDNDEVDNELDFNNFTSVVLFNTFIELGIIKYEDTI